MSDFGRPKMIAMSEELHRAVKLVAAHEGRPMYEVVEKAVMKYTKEHLNDEDWTKVFHLEKHPRSRTSG
jgi:hypothetical protein